MKNLILLIVIILYSLNIYAQCECTDCPLDIEEETTQSSFLDISGATNPELGVNGQALCMVCLNLTQDAMEELDINLIAPDGSSVALTVNDVIGFGQSIFFEICFVPCSQSADPDAGFADVFDTSNDWQDFTTYDGTYYPQEGCLEDLTGDINGEWELEITDVLFAENGELFDWYLVFSDDTGLGCANSGECSESICSAEGGELNVDPIILCEGDSGLDIDIAPSFPNNNEPPVPEFDYTWIIVDADTDVIEDINPETDLTSYPPGNYLICGLSFLSDDESQIPTPNGSLTVDDINDDIDDEDYCADISDDCVEVTIGSVVTPPDFDGPLVVCADEIATYTILDYDPSFTYFVSFTGAVSFFSGSDDVYEIAWTDGPAQICAIIVSPCGNEETCIDVEISGAPEELEIVGNLDPCPGATEIYTFEPAPNSGESYVINVTGGTITNTISSNSVEIEWPDIEGGGEICIELIGGACPPEEFCEDIDIEIDFEIPDELDTPVSLCGDETGITEISGDSDVIEYIWTVTNLEILDGQNTEAVEYGTINPGLATVCLEIITACDIQGPVCEELDVLEGPEPEIDEVIASCSSEFTLISNADPANDILWTLVSGPGSADIDDETSTTTDVSVDIPGEYIFQIEESNNGCVGIEEIEVEILDELTISDFDFDCSAGETYTVTFTILNGESPYFVDGIEISGDTYTSSPIDSEDEFEFVVSDDIGCSAIAEDEFTCPCLTEAGNMNSDLIVLCVAEETFFIAEYENDGVFDNNDVGAFYLHDEDDDQLGEIFDFNSTGEFEYDEGDFELDTEYFISFVIGNDDGSVFPDLNDDCLSVSFGQPVVFYDLPEINFIFDESTCANTIVIDGELDEETTIFWRQVAGPGNSFFSDAESLPVTIEVSELGDYSYEAEIQNDACTNFIEIDIEFIVPAVISNVNESCNSSADFYTVSFEITGGTPPYTSSIPGSFNLNVFTSDPIPTGQSYNVSVTDANGCTSASIDGNKLCDCLSSAGFMNSDLISICITSDSLSVNEVSNSNLDGDDLGLYFLHTSSTNTLGDIVAISNDNVFNYTPNIILDSIYFVSFVVGNNINNEIQASDPCLDISNGQPVIWNSIPLVNAGLDQATCDVTFVLNAQPNNGQWAIIDFPNTLSDAPQLPNAFNDNFTVSDPGEYVLTWNTSNGLCSNSDTVIFTKFNSPNVVNIQTECSQDLLTYNLAFDIEDSNPPYLVNGISSSENYSDSNLMSDISSQFLISNSQGCETIVDVGPISCECQSEAGTIVNALQNLCSFDFIDVEISNNDFILEVGDTLAYIVHDGDENSIGNIIAISYGDDIPYNSDFEFNTTYFIAVAIANIVNGEIDLDDTCLQASESAPIIFTEEINVSIADQLEGCFGESVAFTVNSNIYPIDIIFENNNGDQISETITDENYLVSTVIDSENETWTIDAINNECVNIATGSVEIFGQENTVFELLPEVEICNNALFGSSININDIFIGDIPQGEWTLNNVVLNNDELIFTDLTPGEYTVTYSTIGFDNLCPGIERQIVVTVIECLCPQFNNPDITICNDSPNISLSGFDVLNLSGTWEVSNPGNNSNAISINNDEIEFSNVDAGTYILTYNINDANHPIECDQSTSLQITVEQFLSAGFQNSIPTFCDDENVEINLNDYLDNEDTGGEWRYNGSSLNGQTVNTQDLDIGENNFTYTFADGSICAGSETDLVIIKEAVPNISVIAKNVLCFGADDGEIEIIVENPNGELIECFVNDILQNGEKTISDLPPGTYNVYVKQGNCISETTEVIIAEPAPLSVELGDDQEILVNEEVIIQAIVNILESDIANITWSDLSGALGVSELELISTFENNNTITIQISDENGCIAFDEINIRVSEPIVVIEDIYIPNVFNPEANDNNNVFSIQNTEQIDQINTFLIYDRWGNKVFDKSQSTSLGLNIEWDGYFENKPAIQGVYVYMIQVTLFDGEVKTFAGDVTLIR